MSAVKQEQETIRAGTWKLDAVHSSAEFAVEHAGLSKFRGRVPGFDATLEVGNGQAVVKGLGDPASLKTDNDDLSGHLQSADFFDSERHPQVRFESKAFAATPGEHEIEGELELRGTSRPVTVPARVSEPVAGPDGAERVGVALAATIDRTDYGFDWQMELPGGGPALANEVELTVELELVHEEA